MIRKTATNNYTSVNNSFTVIENDNDSSSFIKTAELITKNTRNNKEFDLVKEMSKHADDSIFLRALAIKANEVNQNGDFFSEDELKKAMSTFVGVPLFCNHENGKVEEAKGLIIASEWDPEVKGIYVIGRVDKKSYPKLSRGIEDGYINGVSMGCSVDYSKCSACKHKATSEKEFCEHIKTKKGKVVNGKKVYEENYGVKFIELSFVTDPACPTCLVDTIINPAEYLKKTAQTLETTMVKYSTLSKQAGKKEWDLITKAYAYLKTVTKKMIEDIETMDHEFIENIVTILGEMQEFMSELVASGYAEETPENMQQAQQQVPPEQMYPEVTAESINKLIKEAEKLEKQIDLKVKKGSSMKKGDKNEFKKRLQEAVSKIPSVAYVVQVKQGDKTLTFDGDELAYHSAGTIVENWKLSSLDEDLQEKFKNDTESTAKDVLQNLIIDEGRQKMANGNKKIVEAAINQLEQTTEAQLKDNNPTLHPRVDKPQEVITEKQLDGEKVSSARKDAPAVITEAQLEAKGDTSPREDKPVEAITEAQLEAKGDTSPRENKPRETITENQLETEDVANRKNAPVNVLTEAQLNDQKSALARKASADELVVTVTAAIAATTLATRTVPQRVMKIARTLTASPSSQVKMIDEIKSVNATSAKRIVEAARYWGQGIAPSISDEDVKTVLLNKLAESGIDKEQLVTGLEVIASDENNMDSVNDAIKHMATEVEEPEIVDEKESIRMAAQKLRTVIAGNGDVIVSAEDIGVDEKSPDFAEKASQAAVKEAASKGLKVTAVHKINKEDEGVYKISVTAESDSSSSKEESSSSGSGSESTSSSDETKEASEDETKKILADIEERARKRIAEVSEAIKKSAEKTGMNKTAQFGGEPGGMPGGPGAAPAAPMPGGPADPAAGGGLEALGAPPAGAPASAEMPAEAPAAEEGPAKGEAQPPGSICPVCGTDDVDLLNGEGRCNSCDAEFEMSVRINVKKWPGTIEESAEGSSKEEKGGEGLELEEGASGEAPVPEAGIPAVAASMKVSPDRLVKVAGRKQVIGEHCPNCGSEKVKLASGNGSCLTCNQKYEVQILPDKDDSTFLWASVIWTPLVKKAQLDDMAGGDISAPVTDAVTSEEPVVPEGDIRAEVEACDCDQSVKDLIIKLLDDGNEDAAKAALDAAKATITEEPVTNEPTPEPVGDELPVEPTLAKDKKNVKEASATEVQNKNKVRLNYILNKIEKEGYKFTSPEGINSVTKLMDMANWSDQTSAIATIIETLKAKNIITGQDKKVSASTDCPDCERRKYATVTTGSKFPMATCMEKLSRRFGENALALSGPCRGNKLAECVCKQLSKVASPTESLMMKMAETLSEPDQMETCIEDQIRGGYAYKQACSICDSLRKKVASVDELIVQAILDTDLDEKDDKIDLDKNLDSMDISSSDEEPASGSTSTETPASDSTSAEAPASTEKPASTEASASTEAPTSGSGSTTEESSALPEPPTVEEEMIEEGEFVEEEVEKDALLKAKDALNEAVDAVNEAIAGKTTEELPPVDLPAEIQETALEPNTPAPELEVNKPLGESIENDAGKLDGGAEPNIEEINPTETPVGPETEEEKMPQEIFAALSMKGNMVKTQRQHLDSIKISDFLRKIAGDKKVQDPKPVEDSSGLKGQTLSQGDKSQMGQEGKPENAGNTDKNGPKVPSRGDASKMGGEKQANPDAITPSVPADNAVMGQEGKGDNAGTPEGIVETKGTIIAQTQKKTAGDKSLTVVKEVENAKGLKGQTLSQGDKSQMGQEGKPENAGNTKKTTPEVPARGNASKMGGEKQANPDAAEPKVPADNAVMGQEGKGANAGTPEGIVEAKGTIIASENIALKKELDIQKVMNARIKEASKIAAAQVKAGLISEEEFEAKVEQLSSMPIPAIKDYAAVVAGQIEQMRKIASSSSKQAQLVDGIETPLSLGSTGEEPQLKDKLMKMFSLNKNLPK